MTVIDAVAMAGGFIHIHRAEKRGLPIAHAGGDRAVTARRNTLALPGDGIEVLERRF